MVGVGEMIASAVVKQVTSRLIQIAGDEIALQWKFKGEVDKMVEKMKDLEAVMHDADNKVSRGGDVGQEVGRWLVKLKSVAYDVEDLLDDLDTKNKEAKLKVFFSCNNQAYQWIARPHNLVDVRKRIEEIENERKPFNLLPQAHVERSRKNETFAAISDRGTSTGMQGRSAEKEKLVNLILRNQANEDISIIPIVGLGGIGKTTLAQSVYADKRVDKKFDIRAWVHVSEKFDLLKIMRAIIKSVDANINLDKVTLQFLQNRVYEKLAYKKYLIVLDDFWEEGGDNLEELKQMLRHGSSGSRIIVTTRTQSVVKKLKTGVLAHQRLILPVQESDQINLGILSTDDCWELIKIRAFGPDDDPTPLNKIGYEIAGKCGGLPLVANAFGQVMSEDTSIKAWEDIKVSMVDLGLRGSCQNGTLESLKLSYHYMKPEFKICFAYLAAFPKGVLIDTNRLIQQWNALGYIYSKHNGESCINYLLGMSFLQFSGDPMVNRSPVHVNASQDLTLHDLIYDLASIITGDEFLVLDADANGPRSWKNAIHCRHAELIQYQNQANVFGCLPKKLRSLHIRDSQKWQLPPKAFSRSKYMRILDLACSAPQLSQGQSASSKIMLPRSIEKLKLLRYLDSTGLPVPSFPKSFCTLENLETLIMSNCSLQTLPDNICSLHKLCYLDLSSNSSLDKLPTRFGKLSILSFLKLSGCSVLQELPQSICELTCLQHLDMSECRSIQYLPDKFGSLPNLLFLNLSGCSTLTKLPDIFSLKTLEHLNLSCCHELENLPHDFGNLENLGFLNLSDCYKVSVLPESFCKLIHLEELNLTDCHELKELPNCFGGLSELKSLNLTSCSKLQLLPESLCDMLKLRHLNFSYCMSILPSFGKLYPRKLDINRALKLEDRLDGFNTMTSLTQLEYIKANPDLLKEGRRVVKNLKLSVPTVRNVHQVVNERCGSMVEPSQSTCRELEVEQLSNLRDSENAQVANLHGKLHLQKLPLIRKISKPYKKSEQDKSSLEMVKAFPSHQYMRKDFPHLIRELDIPLHSLTQISLSGLKECFSLPAFGLVPSLRSLHLGTSPNIRKIGREFYGDGGTPTKLRIIHLESMENLEEWWTTQSGRENEEFLIPNLHSLTIKDCPKLKFFPYPPRSMLWVLDNSDNIFPEGGFGNLRSPVVPTKMLIENCNSPNKWHRLEHFPTLENFIVQSCSSLRTLPKAIGCFTSLVTLYLISLEELGTLPECLGRLTSLEDIIVLDCPRLTSLPESMKNLAALKTLCLKGCQGLEILPEGIGQLISLQQIYISVCSNLTSFPESMKNLSALRTIWLNKCPGLDVLPEWLGQLTSLQELSIILCPNLTPLAQSIRNLAALKKLRIEDCPILLQRCQGQDAHKISHIPELTLSDNGGIDPHRKKWNSLKPGKCRFLLFTYGFICTCFCSFLHSATQRIGRYFTFHSPLLQIYHYTAALYYVDKCTLHQCV